MRAELEMLGFGCPSCAYAIEKSALRIPGIDEVRVDLARHRIRIAYDGNPRALPAVQDLVRQLGHDTRILADA